MVYRELLHSRWGCLKQLMLPCSLCAVVLRHMHDGHGHQRVQRILQLVHARCYWLEMYSDIQEYYRQMRALHRGKSPAATGSYRIGESVGILTTEGAGHGFYSLRPFQQWARKCASVHRCIPQVGGRSNSRSQGRDSSKGLGEGMDS